MRAQRPNDLAAAEVVSSSSSTSTPVVPAVGDDSGYSTESSNNNASGDPSSSTDTGGTTTSGNNTSSSDPDSSDPFFTDDDDFEDVQERIEYIREKQQILQRASGVLLYDDEETYNAATARESSRTPQELQDELQHQDECTIWGEAKDVLRQISSTSKEAEADIAMTAASRAEGKMGGGRVGGSNPVKRSAAAMTSTFLHHAKSRGEINLTSVNHVASLSYDKKPLEGGEDDAAEKNSAEQQQQHLLATLPTVTFGKGQWMAQALVRMSSASSQQKEVTSEDSDSSNSNHHRNSSSDNSSSSVDPQDCRWKVISDPFTCSLGLVPPSNISMHNAVSIEEAITYTSEARLVTQATPPFCVVFVNKAFLILAGLSSKESLIGKPVESILMVPQDFLNPHHTEDINTTTNNNSNKSNSNGSSDCSLHCILSSSSSSGDRDVTRACRMQIVPVLDRFRRRRLSMSSYSCMSHLMIRLHDTRKKVVTIAEVLPAMERGRNKVVRHNNHNNNNVQQQQQQHGGGGGGNHRGGGSGDKLLGTVG